MNSFDLRGYLSNNPLLNEDVKPENPFIENLINYIMDKYPLYKGDHRSAYEFLDQANFISGIQNKVNPVADFADENIYQAIDTYIVAKAKASGIELEVNDSITAGKIDPKEYTESNLDDREFHSSTDDVGDRGAGATDNPEDGGTEEPYEPGSAVKKVGSGEDQPADIPSDNELDALDFDNAKQADGTEVPDSDQEVETEPIDFEKIDQSFPDPSQVGRDRYVSAVRKLEPGEQEAVATTEAEVEDVPEVGQAEDTENINQAQQELDSIKGELQNAKEKLADLEGDSEAGELPQVVQELIDKVSGIGSLFDIDRDLIESILNLIAVFIFIRIGRKLGNFFAGRGNRNQNQNEAIISSKNGIENLVEYNLEVNRKVNLINEGVGTNFKNFLFKAAERNKGKVLLAIVRAVDSLAKDVNSDKDINDLGSNVAKDLKKTIKSK